MKKSMILLLGLLLFGLPHADASVSNMTAQLGVYNSTDTQYGLEVDNNNKFVFSPTSASIYYPGSTASTNQTLTAAQSGQTIVFNNGAGTAANGTLFTLPTATVGMYFTIVADVAKWFYVDAQLTDTINFSTATAGQRVSNSGSAAAGDSIVLACFTANKWSMVDHNGTWAVGPGQ